MIQLFNTDNLEKEVLDKISKFTVACIYADVIYENKDLSWLPTYWSLLSENGVIIIQTDYHTVADYKLLLDSLPKSNFINWAIYIQEWGGTSKRFFPRKHDDILIYSKGVDYKFYWDRITVPKKTANTLFNKSGNSEKIPCDVFYDLGNFLTTDKERVIIDGKRIQWQKPLKLMDRLLLPFTDENDLVVDPFLGSGTTGVWCKINNRRFIGIEKDEKIYKIARERIISGSGS